MNINQYDELESETEEFSDASADTNTEVSLSKKLERRRKIEEIMERKRLEEELTDFG